MKVWGRNLCFVGDKLALGRLFLQAFSSPSVYHTISTQYLISGSAVPRDCCLSTITDCLNVDKEKEEGRGTENMRKPANEDMGKDVVGRREGVNWRKFVWDFLLNFQQELR